MIDGGSDDRRITVKAKENTGASPGQIIIFTRNILTHAPGLVRNEGTRGMVLLQDS